MPIFFAAFGVLLLALGLDAGATIVTLNPSADAFVTTGPTNDLINNNYGAAGALAVSAPGLAKGEFQSLLRFDASTAVASFNSTFGVGQWVLNAATLTFTAAEPLNPIFNGNGAGPGGSNVNFAGKFTIGWLQNDGWVEGTGTPKAATTDGVSFSTLGSLVSAGDVALGTFSFGGATSGANTWTLSLDPSFTGDVEAGGNVSFRLFAADTMGSDLGDANSFGTAAARPVLSLSAVVAPEPGTLTLLAFGAILGPSRRRLHAPQA